MDVTLVPDGLQRGTAGQELLQLVSGLLVVGGVHAGGDLHACRGQMRPDRVVHRSSKRIERHGGPLRALRDS